MRKGGLEPPRGNPHYHLKVARIPIPPLPHNQRKDEREVTIRVRLFLLQGKIGNDLRYISKIFSLI